MRMLMKAAFEAVSQLTFGAQQADYTDNVDENVQRNVKNVFELIIRSIDRGSNDDVVNER